MTVKPLFSYGYPMKKWICSALLIAPLLPLTCQAADNPTLRVPQSSLSDTTLVLGQQDEVKLLDQMIVSTTTQLQMLEQLKEKMVQFQQQRDAFIKGDQTKSHTGRMVRTARQIYEILLTNHLDHLLAKDYLDELIFFSSIAGKNAVTRP